MTFVVLEGGEGSGKSTQSIRHAPWMGRQGHEVVSTFEPGDTKLGAHVRDLLLHREGPLDPRSELLLMLADRAQHVTEVIRPALARGAVVISDRYSPSTLAYQGVGRGLGVAAVEQMDDVATGGLVPDIVVVLDVPDDVAEARVASVRDRLEGAGRDFHSRVRAAYRVLAAERGWRVVDGSGEPDDVELLVREAVTRVLP